NHVFSFDKTSEQLHYKMLTHKNAVGYIALLLSELNNIVPEKVEPKTRFCIQCGSEIIQGGKFCGKCGAKIPS
ncbi:MAG: zinc ribbon domain-containing protein, partial [Bacteroidota bacterium]